jgi:peptidoglycan/LPS O-acetylase OafA/YrhL
LGKHTGHGVSTTLDRLTEWGTLVIGHTIWASGGTHPGVIVFIVLSGFCIHLPQLLRPGELRTVGFWHRFAVRRALRIGPVFLLGVLFGSFAAHLTSGMPSLSSPGWSGDQPIWWFRYVALVNLTTLRGLLPIGDYPLGNGPLDTVEAEAWLYASYPVFLFALERWGKSGLIGAGIALQAVAVSLGLLSQDMMWAGRSYWCFALYWMIGVLAAERYVASRPGTPHAIPWLAIGSTFVVYVLASHVIDFRGSHYLKNGLLAAWTGYTLAKLCAWEQSTNRVAPRAIEWLRAIGERSYSLYALHFPLLTITAYLLIEADRQGPWTIRLLPLLVAALGAALCYRYLERPSHELARRLAASMGMRI